MQKQIEIPQKILDSISKDSTYYLFLGGRTGAKSESMGRIIIKETSLHPITVVCCREFQASIKDSVHSLLKYIIELYGFTGFTILDNEIRHTCGSKILFKGLKKESVGSLKSIPNIALLWVEEAQYISRKSLDILIPTVRQENSKIIFTMNPEEIDDPVYNDFYINKRYNPEICFINYLDNPFVTQKSLDDANYDKENDIERYNHVWLGECKKVSDEVIFKNKYIVDYFEPAQDVDYLFGADFGVTDPNTLIRMFIKDNCLYIDQEMYKIGQELDDMPEAYDKVLDINYPDDNTEYEADENNEKEKEYYTNYWRNKFVIKADCSRPETINFLQRKGFTIVGENKLTVDEGIAFIRNFKKIIIHPICVNVAFEFKSYKWKTNKQTGEIINIPEDKNNHCIDAIRYALRPLIAMTIKKAPTRSINANIF